MLPFIVATLAPQNPTGLFSRGLYPISVDSDARWSVIDRFVKGKQVIGIGECTHGSHEVFVAKANLIKHLILTQGFRGLAMELPYATSLDIEKYVTEGIGDPTQAIRSAGFWTVSNEEFLDLVKWIREFNGKQKSESLVHVLGVDMQDTFQPSELLQSLFRKAELKITGLSDAYWYTNFRYQAEQKKIDLMKAMRQFSSQASEAFKAKSDFESVRQVEMAQLVYEQAMASIEILNRGEDLWEMQASTAPYIAKTADDVGSMAATRGLSLASKTTIENFMKMSGQPADPILLVQQLRSAATELKALDASEPAKRFVSVMQMLAQAVVVAEDRKTSFRDIKMAENVLTLRSKFFSNKPTIFWAHNSHISQGDIKGIAYFAGANLAKMIGSRYYSIGFAFHSGSFNAYSTGESAKLEARTVGPAKADSLEAMLHQTGASAFFADLKAVDEKTQIWLSAPHPNRGFGSHFEPTKPDMYYETFAFSKWFQGLIYVDSLAPAKQIPLN